MIPKIEKPGIASIIIAGIGVSVALYTIYSNNYNSKTKRDDNYISKYVECKEDIAALERRLNTIELATLDLPFALWIKDLDSRIIFLNKEYDLNICKPLNIKPENLLNTKGEIFGDEFVKEIIFHDRQVITEDRTIAFKENLPNLGPGVSYKYPIHSKFGGVRGTGGIWIPDRMKSKN